ncbi:MAG TPA: hypothetical protein ENN81_08310 [Phycisphaerales bacterium]|nr:hypothetical protein [Phycisphaerales bacterium]
MKNDPNHAVYIRLMRRLTPEQRLAIALDLSEFSKWLFIEGLRKLYPDLPLAQFGQLVRRRLEKCHNRNY